MPKDVGSYGGNGAMPCPRCGKQRNATRSDRKTLVHQVPELTDSRSLRETTAAITLALAADKDLFVDRARLDKAFFMVGVLEATIGGQPRFFASSSGWKDQNAGLTWLRSEHLAKVSYHAGKWEIHHPNLPGSAKEWRTVLGHDANVPPDVHGQIKPCAAIRLLIQVAQSNAGHKPITGMKICEMVFVGKDVDLTAPRMQRSARVWKGKMTGSSWTAHSCAECMASLPYLICSLAPNEFIPPDERSS